MQTIKSVDYQGKKVEIKTKQKTITIDEDYAYLVRSCKINASDMMRNAIANYILLNPNSTSILNDFYKSKLESCS
jgi:hypothetical protein